MKNLGVSLLVAGLCILGFASATVRADDDEVIHLRARLTGFQEVAPKNTTATGTFAATISEDRKTIHWTVSWANLSGPPIQSHIHIGQKGVNGAIMVFFCGAAANPPNTKGPCPQLTSATISGTIVAADIIPIDSPAPPGQGFTNGDLADVIRYILAGDGYANVHTAKYPSGEIRGQIRVRPNDDEHDRD